MRIPRTIALIAVASLSALGCGRTEALWWADIYASDTGTEDQGDGDGDGDPDTTTTPGDGDGDWGQDTTDTDTDTTDTDTTDTDTTTTDTETETETADTETETSCDEVPVALTGQPSSVVFVLDQGAHMGLDFDGQTRWEAIGEALLDQGAGVVWAWEDVHRLGLVSFTSQNGNQGGECPMVEGVDPGFGAGAAMEVVWGGLNPADDSPAGEALEFALSLFNGQPGHIVLVLGRNPDTCASPNNQQQGAAAVSAAVQGAYQAGVETRVVRLGNLSANLAQSLANLGVGLDPQGQVDAPYAEPLDTPALQQDLDAILGQASSCAFNVDPVVLEPRNVGFCTLELDGQEFPVDDPDGWSALAPDQLQLAGAACEAYRGGALPSMSCSCQVL